MPIDDRPHELLAFITSFGLLGQTVLAGRPRRRGKLLYMADDVAWALLHARNIDRIMRLYSSRFASLDELLLSLDVRSVKIRALGQSTWESVSHPITLRVPSLEGVIGIRLDTIAIALLAGEKDEHGKPLTETARRRLVPKLLRERPLDVSRQIIAALLNPNLQGVTRAYDPAGDRPTFTFPTLIQLVYWQLADRLGHYEIRQCPCGALFFADDKREGWHSRQCFRQFYMRDYRKGKLRRNKLRGKERA